MERIIKQSICLMSVMHLTTNPEIAYAIMIPHVSTNQRDYGRPHNEIAFAIVDKYFELKAIKAGQVESSTVVEEIKPPLESEEE